MLVEYNVLPIDETNGSILAKWSSFLKSNVDLLNDVLNKSNPKLINLCELLEK